jgi:hypothetical protein
MTQAALERFTATHHAIDPRADGAKRIVHVSATQVTIERTLQGVRMRVGVPIAAYRDLAIAVRLPAGNATLSLRHDDSELDVVLASGEAMALAAVAKDWSKMLDKPIAVEKAYVAMHEAIGRRTKRFESPRRSKFSRRRKTGLVARMDQSFAHEDEIIART